jgi:hypothetical protein
LDRRIDGIPLASFVRRPQKRSFNHLQIHDTRRRSNIEIIANRQGREAADGRAVACRGTAIARVAGWT